MKQMIVLLMGLLISSALFAHGENMPGPHGGFIRMPGAFHTEVIPEKTGFKVMLLDINFKNPTIKNSSLKVAINNAGKTIPLKCAPAADYFFCTASNDVLKQKGTLQVLAQRNQAAGMSVNYPLPLA